MDVLVVLAYNYCMIKDRMKLLGEGWFSFWSIGDKPKGDPFKAFEDKYGYYPKFALIGKSSLNLPDSIEIVGTTTPGHIGLR